MTDYLTHRFDMDDPDLISTIDELPLWSAPFGLRLLETIKLKKNMKVLDIGCGLGFPLIELSQRLGKSSRVYGIDPWQKAIERARLKAKVYNISNVEIVEGYAEKMPFENGFFELIVSNNGINNVEDIQQTLKECYRVCKTGAQMVFTLNLQDTMIEFYRVFEETLQEENLHSEIAKMKEQIYAKRKPLEEIEALVKTSGFSIIKVVHDVFNIKFVDGTSMFNHYLIKYWFLPGWKDVLKEEDMVSIFDKVETKLNQHAEINREISLTVPFVTINCERN
jgi:ubiquinone/menaquinone biosynthesis C-methylase UbiE